MLTVIVSLAGAFVYGAADFLGGLASKRTSPVAVTAIAAATGFALLLAGLLVVPSAWSAAAVGWGALSGVTGAAAISLLYACLALGPMSILSPVTAVVSALVPMLAGIARGERLAPLGYGALCLILVAVVLVGFVPEKGAVRPTVRGLSMAVASGALIGVFFILIDLTPDDSGLVPLVLNRGVSAVIMGAATIALLTAAKRRRATDAATPAAGAGAPQNPGRLADSLRASARPAVATRGVALAAACGVVDTAANVLLLVGVRIGDLTVVSVITALYPAGTIVLAAVVLRERIAPVQIVGLVLAIAGAGLLAAA